MSRKGTLPTQTGVRPLTRPSPPVEPPAPRLRLLAVEVPLFLVAAAALSCWAQFLEPRRLIARDSLYHLGHAGVYATHGLTYHEFPWTTFSVIRAYAADIWYGFHVLLIPFTRLHYPPEQQVSQVKWAGVFLTAALLMVFYLTMRRSRVLYPWVWPFLLVVPSMYRFAQVRPQLLSTAVVGVLFAALVSGGVWAVFWISAALSWLHLALFWLGLLTTIAVVAVKWRTEKVLEWQKLVATVAGLAVGWLLRPNPIGAARIVYAQIFQLLLHQGQKIPLSSFGVELSPLPLSALLENQGIYVGVWCTLCALVLVGALVRRTRVPVRWWTWLWSSLALSALFFGMTVRLYLRAIDSWMLFATLLMAGAVTCLWTMQGGLRDALARRPARAGVAARAGLFILAAGLCAGMAWQQLWGFGGGFVGWMTTQLDPYRFRSVGEWMTKNTPAGSIVFHANWSIFPELFFWDRHNRYIGGMDPIFEYAYDERLYWSAAHLDENPFAGGNTWGVGAPDTVGPIKGYYPVTLPGSGADAFAVGDPVQAQQVDTYTALRRDFHASYLFVTKDLEAARLSGRPDPDLLRRNREILLSQQRLYLPMLYVYAWQDPRFVCRYEDSDAIVFEITKP
jgi:hypothetical protein